PAQADVAADRLGLGVGRVQGQVEVAADAAHVGLAGRGGDGDVAADAFDVQVARGHAVDVDVGRNRFDVQVGAQRHLQDQRGRPGAVAAPAAHPSRIFNADFQVLAVAVDHQLLDAVADGAGDAHLVAVPGAHFDAALDVLDVDAPSRIQRAGLDDAGAAGQRCAGEAGADGQGDGVYANAHWASPRILSRQPRLSCRVSACWVSARPNA